MGLFDKITKAFEKKNCDFCGAEIGLLGNRKLEDGNMCGKCAAKLSPFFDGRRHSTVEEIREQLNYRESNRRVLDTFQVNRNLGADGQRILVDDSMKAFVIVRSNNNWKDNNPDVISLADVTGCRIDVDEREDRDEIKRKDAEGKEVSYNPPRYKYSYHYNVKLILNVNHPYFDEIKISVNNSTIESKVKGVSEQLNNCKEIANEMKSAILGQAGDFSAGNTAPVQEEVKTVNCPFCGAATTPVNGKCEFCGAAI